MKKILGLVVALMLMAVPVFASSYDDYNDNRTYNYDNRNYNTANGGTASATGGTATVGNVAGGSSTVTSTVSPTITVNPNIHPEFSNDVDVNIGGGLFSRTLSPDATATATQRQDQGQIQGQTQGQGQEMNNKQNISPTQTTTIKVDKPFMAAPSTVAPEVNHGSGKVNFNFKEILFGIPLYDKTKENVKSLIIEKHNIGTDDLISTVLKMKKDEGVLTYNTRLILIQKEAQKSYAFSIIGVPVGSGALGTTGVAGSAVVGPSFAGTKANDLFDAYLVKVE